MICVKVVVQGTVFARFSPEQKQQLIESLQDVGYVSAGLFTALCEVLSICGDLKKALEAGEFLKLSVFHNFKNPSSGLD